MMSAIALRKAYGGAIVCRNGAWKRDLPGGNAIVGVRQLRQEPDALRRQRKNDLHESTRSCASQSDLSLKIFDALAHAGNADANAAWPKFGDAVGNALAVVLNGADHAIFFSHEVNARLRGSRMTKNVR